MHMKFVKWPLRQKRFKAYNMQINSLNKSRGFGISAVSRGKVNTDVRLFAQSRRDDIMPVCIGHCSASPHN